LIDFRYHLVSIVAVFLALAIGIVVGVQGVSPKVANTLNSETQRVAKINDALSAQNSQLKRQISADQAFAQAASGLVLGHLLQGERVVIVTAPGADTATVDGISSAVNRAGGALTGQVSLTPQFFDTGTTTETTLANTAGQLAPAGFSLPDSGGAQIFGQQAAGKLIAAALAARDRQAALSPAQSQAVLDSFGQQGFLHVSGAGGSPSLTGQAALAVVVIPGGAPGSASALSPENLALIWLAHYLQFAGKGAVLAGSLQGSGPGSAIAAVTTGGAGVSLSTVDNADSVTGQIIVVQVLSELLGPHAAASSYGVGPLAVPSPAPSTVPTPVISPARKIRKKTVKR